TAHDELSYLHEFEHLTLARLLIAQFRADRSESTIREAQGLLERLLLAAQSGGRTGSANEGLVLQALAYAAQGNFPQALAPLGRALDQAEREGYVRLFADEGAAMAALLQAAAQRGLAPGYVQQLLGAFGQPAAPPGAAPQSLPEPLSERELEV